MIATRPRYSSVTASSGLMSAIVENCSVEWLRKRCLRDTVVSIYRDSVYIAGSSCLDFKASLLTYMVYLGLRDNETELVV